MRIKRFLKLKGLLLTTFVILVSINLINIVYSEDQPIIEVLDGTREGLTVSFDVSLKLEDIPAAESHLKAFGISDFNDLARPLPEAMCTLTVYQHGQFKLLTFESRGYTTFTLRKDELRTVQR